MIGYPTLFDGQVNHLRQGSKPRSINNTITKDYYPLKDSYCIFSFFLYLLMQHYKQDAISDEKLWSANSVLLLGTVSQVKADIDIDSDPCHLAIGVSCSEFNDAYIKAKNLGSLDRFGYSVALSDNTLVVGAPYDDSYATGVNGDQMDNSVKNSGAVYVFVKANGVWKQQAYLKASNTNHYDIFGSSVTIDGEF